MKLPVQRTCPKFTERYHAASLRARRGHSSRHHRQRTPLLDVRVLAAVSEAQEEAIEHAEEKAREADQDIEKILSHNITDDDVLHVPDIRDQLNPQPSPFCKTNNRGGGCGQHTAYCQIVQHLTVRRLIAISVHFLALVLRVEHKRVGLEAVRAKHCGAADG